MAFLSQGTDLAISTKSQRNADDCAAAMGMGAINTLGRVAASICKGPPVQPSFLPSLDVPNGGVLFSLPALLATGLLCHAAKYLQMPNGYYGMESILLLLAFMALSRIKSVETLRYYPPGEWGKLLGLDRIPEVKVTREKIELLASGTQATEWGMQLCSDWMGNLDDSWASFYVDGHVRVYFGEQTQLPRHYVARQKLCLRATTDYWVNAMDGQPFFFINKPIDPGLLKVLDEDIVPRLEQEFPMPTDAEVLANPHLHRFVVIFDREGYSPDFFLAMKNRHIACLTYHKHPGNDWRPDEFDSTEVKLVSGNVVKMDLAERGILLAGKVWLREIRKRSNTGHQTSILSTEFTSDKAKIASTMFARWSQENFFKYMREHYSLDRLIDHKTSSVNETTKVVNPKHRSIASEVRKRTAIHTRLLAKFGSLNLKDEIDPEKVLVFQQAKAKLHEEINDRHTEIEKLKAERKTIATHITFSALPKEDKFKQLSDQSKYFVDTLKMVAYRSETAMVQVLREKLSRNDDARSLIRAIYNAEADLIPNEEEKTLKVYLHQLANHSSNDAVQHLCDEINKTETIFPGTNLKIIYKLGSVKNPRHQDV